MSIQGIRDAIKTGLGTISGLNTYDNVPDSVNVPCAFPVPVEADYDYDAGGNYLLRFQIILLISRAGDIEEKQEKLDDYIVASGSKSIKAAVEAADYSTHAHYVRVIGFRDYGGMIVGGINYIGCRFLVEVMA